MSKSAQPRVQFSNTLKHVVSRVFIAFTVLAILTPVAVSIYSITRAGEGAENKAYAAISNTMNFQARLMGTNGMIVADGTYNVEFKLYNASTSSGSSQGSCTGDANCLWTETRTGGNKVTVKGGYLSVYLGSVTALPSDIWDQQLYLTMNIGGAAAPTWDGEMTPRIRLSSVPSAFRAQTAVSAESLSKNTGSFTGSVTFANMTADRSFLFPDTSLATTGSPGTICVFNGTASNCPAATGSTYYIQNTAGSATPQTAANFNIQATDNSTNGTVAGILRGAAGGQTVDLLQFQASNGTVLAAVTAAGNLRIASSLDVLNAGTLSIGTSTATAITLGKSGITTTNAGALSVTELFTANAGANITGATNINTSGSATTTIGNSGAGIVLDGAVTANQAATFNENVTVASGKSLRLVGGNTASRPASPTEGMIYFDTDTKTLLIYANGKWQVDGKDALIVAASNSSQKDKDAADYIANGNTGTAADGDQVEINQALTAAAGKKVVLLAGTYVADATISVPNDTTLSGLGLGTVIELADLDVSEELIQNTDTTTGTGVVVRNMKLDGRMDLNTAGTQIGLNFVGLGSGSGTSTRLGGTVSNVTISRFLTLGIRLSGSSNTLISDNTIVAGGGSGTRAILVDSISTNNVITNNILNGQSYGVSIHNSSSQNIVANNQIQGNTYGVSVLSATGNSITSNTFLASTTYGVWLSTNANNNQIALNNFQNTGGATTNNAFYIDNSDSNVISGNTITDSSATTNNYGINIINNTSDTNYLANNSLGGGTVFDAGTGTIYAGQATGSTFAIQPSSAFAITGTAASTISTTAGNLTLQAGSGTVTLGASTALTATGALTITSGGANALTLDAGGAAALNVGTANANAVSIGRTGITATINGALAVTQASTFTGLATFNGGLTVETGDTFTFNGDAFTDLTGSGLTISGGALTVDTTTATGFFRNGGNSFGAAATLGTNDNFSLTLETNNTAALVLDNSQNASFAAGVTIANGLTLTTGALNLTATSGALSLSGLGASSINLGSNNLTVTSGNFNTTATGINGTAIGTTTASTGAFTTLSASGTATFTGNVSQTGSGTLSTGTGAVSLNGATSVTGTNTLTVGTGATSLGGTLTVAGLTTLNGGLTVETGDTFTFNGDAFTDLTGAGLVVTANALTVSTAAGSGFVQFAPASAQGDNSTNASIFINDTAGGNLIQLQQGGTNRFVVDGSGNVTGTGSYTFSGVATDITTGTNEDLTVVANGTGIISLNDTVTVANTLTASNGFTLTTGALNLTATSGAISLSGLGASSINTGANALTFTSSNFNTTATGINGTAIGATTASTGAFTTLSASGATTLNGNTTLGASAGSGTTLTNNGATVATTLALGNFGTGGSIGTANTNVDIYTSISIAQTTASQTITIPAPTANTAYGRIVYVSNIGTSSFMMLGSTLSPGATATLMWTNKDGGAAWVYAGADGNGILNQNTAQQTGNFWISGTGRADTALQSPSFDTATAVALSLGTTNATNITIGHNAGTLTIDQTNFDLSAAGVMTLLGGQTNDITTGSTNSNLTLQANGTGAIVLNDVTTLNGTATFSGVTTDITTATNEDLTVVANGTGTIVLNDTVTIAGTTTYSGVATDITTGTNEDLTVDANGTGRLMLSDSVVIAASQSLRLVGGNTASRPASPTEGMIYFDTDTKTLLVYSNGKWQADGKDAIIVAANNSSQADKDAATYVANGNTGTANDGDQVEINQALTAAAGKKVILLAGTYTVDASISIPNNTTLTGVGNGSVVELADLDASINTIVNADTTTGTGVTVERLKVDGRDDLNTAGTQHGIYLNGLGTAVVNNGITVQQVSVVNFRNSGIYLLNSKFLTVTNVVASENTNGIEAVNVGASTFQTNNTVTNSGAGILLDSAYQSIVDGNTSSFNDVGIRLINGSNNITITDNNVVGTYTYGISVSGNSQRNLASGNSVYDNGGASVNNGIRVSDADFTTIIGNIVGDTSATTDNYAINIAASNADNTYLGDNTLGTGTVNDAGTATVYGGQVSTSGNFIIQPAGTIELMKNTNITGTLTVSGTATFNGALNIGDSTGDVVTINTGAWTFTNDTDLILNGGVNGLSIDGNTFSVDGLNNRIGIGTASPSAMLEVAGAGYFGNVASSANGGSLIRAYTGNTANANSGIDVIRGGTGWTAEGILSFRMRSDGSGVYRGTIGYADGNTPSENITLLSGGNVGIGDASPVGLLTVGSGDLFQVSNTGQLTFNGVTTDITTGTNQDLTFDANGTGIINLNDNVTVGGNVTLAEVTGTRTISAQTRTSNVAGTNVTLSAGAAGSGASAFAGGTLTLQGGAAGGTGNANGGAVTIGGGAGVGTGTQGLVNLATTAFTSASVQTYGAGVTTITQSLVDNFSTIPVTATATTAIASVPNPSQADIGRVLYIAARDGSTDFTLRLNAASTPIDIAMKQNSTATLIWNGARWTAAGASSSTDLQSAYNNTLTSAGGAEILLNPVGGNADGFTIRNNGTTPIVGGLLEVQSSIGSNLLSVNNNSTEYAVNGGAESSTNFSTNWTTTTGGTVDRWNTLGDFVATGVGSTRVQTTTTNHGAKNVLSAPLTAGMTYSVSFAIRGATNFTTLQVLYSPDGTTSGTTTCATGKTVTQGSWTRITCTFIAAGTINSSNAILIRQTDSATRTFYIDNLSVAVNANMTFAADGSVDSALGTNWTAFNSGSPTRTTSELYDTTGAVAVATAATANQGVRNNMAVTPAVNTQYLVTFYAKATVAMSGTLKVGFLPAGGNSVPAAAQDCVDYSTQSVTTTSWTRITCLVTTPGSGISDPDLVIYQTDATARTFYVDALTINLNTNNSNNVQVGGANKGGPTTLLTLDRASTAPIAANNDAYLGSMYYDTTTGRIQCYEADGWGACGSSPDNIISLTPEYTGAVLGTPGNALGAGNVAAGVGVLTADFCSNQTGVLVTPATGNICASGEARNFYRWTSPQTSQQVYSIYVNYKLPTTFKAFNDSNTISLTALTDNLTNGAATLQVFRKNPSAVTSCGAATTINSSINTWQTTPFAGDETVCGFQGGDNIIFKIDVKSQSNGNIYIENLNFVFTNN